MAQVVAVPEGQVYVHNGEVPPSTCLGGLLLITHLNYTVHGVIF